MKLSSRIASVAATGLVALVLPAHAVAMPTGTDTASVPNSNTTRQLAPTLRKPRLFQEIIIQEKEAEEITAVTPLVSCR